MPDVKERVQEFDRLHGESMSDGSMRYYRDGSVRDVDPFGPLIGCECYDLVNPEYEYKVRWNQLRFHQLKLEQAVNDFDDLNTRLAHTASAGDTELQELTRLQGAVEEKKALAAKAQAALDATRKGRQQIAHKQSLADEQARFAAFQLKRRAIRI